MISLSASATRIYTGDQYTLTAQGSPGAEISLMEARFPLDPVIGTHTADGSGRASFILSAAQPAVITHYVQQNCMALGLFCDKSSTVQVTVAARGTTGPGGTTIPAPSAGSPLVLTVDKTVVKTGDPIQFMLSGPPGAPVELYHKTLVDEKITVVTLDGVTGIGSATWAAPNQGLKTFYGKIPLDLLGWPCVLGPPFCGTLSNDIQVTVEEGPCEPWDIGCMLTGGGTGGPLAGFQEWLGETGKTVVILVVVILALYIFAVYVLPGFMAGAAAKATGGE